MKIIPTPPEMQAKQPIRTPHETLADFFEWYSVENAEEELWQWLQQILSTDLADWKDPLKRSELLFFYEKLKALLKAANRIQQDSSEPALA